MTLNVAVMVELNILRKMSKAENYTSDIIQSILSEITDEEQSETDFEMKNHIVAVFSTKYKLFPYSFVTNDVIDFHQYVFTWNEITFALDNNLTLEQILDLQKELMKQRNISVIDLKSTIKFAKICKNYINMSDKLKDN